MAKKTAKTPLKPPVVTIMGHVDHGKTTLLDQIRKSKLTTKEAGGITQSIGAYQIEYQKKLITFIDTPGHAAFSHMRQRGASVTDIVILVVAADDGVKPQTKESIKHIQKAQVPFVVALNKIDLKNAVPDMAKAQLVEEGVQVEGYGGDVPVVEISAAKGTGIDKLLDTILVLAEIEELEFQPQASLQAVVLESSLKKNLGPVTNILIKTGTLQVGDEVSTVGLKKEITGKAKRLFSDLGNVINSAGPSTPATLLGLKTPPPAGSIITISKDYPQVFATIGQEANQTIDQPVKEPEPDSPEPSESDQDEEEPPEVNIILIADNRGSLEAITNSLPDEVNIIKSGTGEVTESDVLLAQTTNSAIIAFNTPISKSAKKLADIEKIPLRAYKIIYKLLEDFESQILKLLEPTIDETELGVAKVKAIFEIRGDTIAGCRLESGTISLKNKVHLKRNDKIIADATVVSLKQGKVDTNQVKKDQECGIILKPVLKLQEGDLLCAFTKNESSAWVFDLKSKIIILISNL